MASQLNTEVAGYRAATYASNTKKSYNSHLKSYLDFCGLMDIPPAPVTDVVVSQYAAYLARRLRPASIKQYLNVIRLLHVECKLPNPCKDSWLISSTIRGIEKTLGNEVKTKTPILPELLLKLQGSIISSNLLDLMCWAASLILFFGMFWVFSRKYFVKAFSKNYDQVFILSLAMYFFSLGFFVEACHLRLHIYFFFF